MPEPTPEIVAYEAALAKGRCTCGAELFYEPVCSNCNRSVSYCECKKDP